MFLSLCLCCSHLTLPLASLSMINITPLSHEELIWSTHNCCRSASNHTPPNQIVADHSPFFSFDQDQTIAVNQLANQDQTTAPDQHQTNAAQSLIKSSLINSLISHCLISGFRVWWVMIWLSDWVGFGLNGFLILGWFDLEWFANQVVMMMVVGSKREREAVKKIIKMVKKWIFYLNKGV